MTVALKLHDLAGGVGDRLLHGLLLADLKALKLGAKCARGAAELRYLALRVGDRLLDRLALLDLLRLKRVSERGRRLPELRDLALRVGDRALNAFGPHGALLFELPPESVHGLTKICEARSPHHKSVQPADRRYHAVVSSGFAGAQALHPLPPRLSRADGPPGRRACQRQHAAGGPFIRHR